MDERRRIAHCVTPFLSVTATWIYSQLINMRVYQPLVITSCTQNLDQFPFEPLYSYDAVSWLGKMRLRLRRGNLSTSQQFAYEAVRSANACLLHCHFGDDATEFVPVKTRLGLPMATSFYGYDMSLLSHDPVWRQKYQQLFQECNCFFVEGPEMKRGLVALGCPADKVIVHHLGVDLDRFPLLPRKPAPDGTVRILVAGTFREKKGIPSALQAFARVREHHKVQLTLLGDAQKSARDQAEKRRILEVIETLRLGDAVRLLGYQPHHVFAEMLRTHDIFLSPSVTSSDGDTEGGSPVAITEAQATGMPVVSTFHADIPEVVLHGTTGLLSKEYDSDALTENLEQLVTHADCWEEMGRRARENVEKEYNVRLQVEKLEQRYSRMLAG
jgi:colanic acid/amylovoran biosynthesis glycosyltransferase